MQAPLIRDSRLEQLQRAAGNCQEIVEVVRDPACQLTDCLELLSLVQARLGLPMLGYLCVQMDIGLVQLRPKSQSCGEKPVEMRSGKRECRREHDDHRGESGIRH